MIEKELRKFFLDHLSPSSFLPFVTDEDQYFILRQQLLKRPTTRQSQLLASVSTANTDSNHERDSHQIDRMSTSLQSTGDKTDYADKLIVHYTHEKRFHSFKRQMHQVYEDVFKNTPAMTVKLIVGSRNRSDARNDLIRKRPQSSLLKNKLCASEYFHFCLFDALKLIRNLFFHEKGHEDNYCSTVHSSITHRLGIE